MHLQGAAPQQRDLRSHLSLLPLIILLRRSKVWFLPVRCPLLMNRRRKRRMRNLWCGSRNWYAFLFVLSCLLLLTNTNMSVVILFRMTWTASTAWSTRCPPTWSSLCSGASQTRVLMFIHLMVAQNASSGGFVGHVVDVNRV